MEIMICKNYRELKRLIKDKRFKVKCVTANGVEAGQYTYLVVYRKRFLRIF